MRGCTPKQTFASRGCEPIRVAKDISATDETIDDIDTRLSAAGERERGRRFRQCIYESPPTS